MNRPGKTFARPLAQVAGKTLNEAFAKQGFASTELVMRWTEIVGAEIGAHSQPEKISWPRAVQGAPPAPGTLLLRVEGPIALEIQHLSGVILERVNRFFGWQAVASLRLRQAPLSRRRAASSPPKPDAAEAARLAADLGGVADEGLRAALARLGAAVKTDSGDS